MTGRFAPGLAVCGALALLTACTKTGTEPRTQAFDALPDWSGIWVVDGPAGVVGVSGYPEGPPFAVWQLLGARAPLKGAAAELLGKLSKATSTEDAQRIAPEFMHRVTLSKAEGWGMPDMMESPAPMQFFITPEETLLVNFYRDVRHIYTDGRPDPKAEDLWPTPWGYSSGHWEGDTLVIQTSQVQPGFGPLTTPIYSAESRFTERIRKTAPDRLESEMTITDPQSLNGEWKLKLAYKRVTDMDRLFHGAFDNDRTAADGEFLTIEAPKTAK
jgi:hypothetical protein